VTLVAVIVGLQIHLLLSIDERRIVFAFSWPAILFARETTCYCLTRKCRHKKRSKTRETSAQRLEYINDM